MARPQPQPTKSKSHKASDALQVERLHQGYAQSMEITKVLADQKSKFQHIRIFDQATRVDRFARPGSGRARMVPDEQRRGLAGICAVRAGRGTVVRD